METKRIVWDREKLYAELWEKPATEVAKAYGVSDVMIKKVCRKLSIPKPPVGYWARKAHGYKDSRPTLKPLAKPIRFESQVQPPREDKRSLLAGLSELKKPLESSKRAAAVVAIEKHYSKRLVDDFGRLCPNEFSQHFAPVNVAPESFPAVLELLDALCKLAAANGISISRQKYPKQHRIQARQVLDQLVAEVDDERIPISFYEPMKLVKSPLTTAQLKEKAERPYLHRRDYNPTYISSGIIELKLLSSSDGPTSWRSSAKPSLDFAPIEIIQAMRVSAKYLKQRTEELRLRVEEEARKQTRARLYQARLHRLESDLENWERAKRVRSFAAALEEGFRTSGTLSEAPVRRRLDWIKRYADDLDPTIDPRTHEDWDVEDDV